MIIYPTVEPYFLAAQQNQAFLTETMTEYVDLLLNPTSLPNKMKIYNLYMQVLKGNDFIRKYSIFPSLSYCTEGRN